MACKSWARMARSVSSSAPMATRKSASDRGSIANKLRQVLLEAAVIGPAAERLLVAVRPGRGRTEDRFGSACDCFFNNTPTIPHTVESKQGKRPLTTDCTDFTDAAGDGCFIRVIRVIRG